MWFPMCEVAQWETTWATMWPACSVEDVSVLKLPNGDEKYLGRTTRKGPGDTKHAQELMHE